MEVLRKDLDGPPLNSVLAALAYRTIMATLLPLRLGLALVMVAHSPLKTRLVYTLKRWTLCNDCLAIEPSKSWWVSSIALPQSCARRWRRVLYRSRGGRFPTRRGEGDDLGDDKVQSQLAIRPADLATDCRWDQEDGLCRIKDHVSPSYLSLAGYHLHFVNNGDVITFVRSKWGSLLIPKRLRKRKKDCFTENVQLRYCASTSISMDGKLQIRRLVSAVAGLHRGPQQ